MEALLDLDEQNCDEQVLSITSDSFSFDFVKKTSDSSSLHQEADLEWEFSSDAEGVDHLPKGMATRETQNFQPNVDQMQNFVDESMAELACDDMDVFHVLGEGICTVGGKKIVIQKEMKAFEILMRPDISQDDVLSLTESVLITLGGSLIRNVTEVEVQLEMSIEVRTNVKFTTRIYMGANARKQRTLVAIISNDIAGSTLGMGLIQGVMGEQLTLQAYTDNLIGQLTSAYLAEGFTLSALIDLCRKSLKVLGSGQDLGDSPERLNRSVLLRDPGLRMSSVVDPNFVRDLQLTFANDMSENLVTAAESLESYVKKIERQCARLMTVLKPTYLRCGLALPLPPPKKALSEYALHMSRKPMAEATVEMARLLILRARRALKDKGTCRAPEVEAHEPTSIGVLEAFEAESTDAWAPAAAAAVMSPLPPTTFWTRLEALDDDDDDDDEMLGLPMSMEGARVVTHHGWAMNNILSHVQQQLRAWADEESRQRLQRKVISVRDRTRDLEVFMVTLLLTLHNRPVDRSTIADRAAMSALREKCRVICNDEPLLLDIPAVVAGRSGTLFITLDHLYFHSAGLFVQSMMKLIPVKTIVAVGRPQGTESSSGNVMDIQDLGGQSTVFEITGPTTDFCGRICDLVDLLKTDHLRSVSVRRWRQGEGVPILPSDPLDVLSGVCDLPPELLGGIRAPRGGGDLIAVTTERGPVSPDGDSAAPTCPSIAVDEVGPEMDVGISVGADTHTGASVGNSTAIESLQAAPRATSLSPSVSSSMLISPSSSAPLEGRGALPHSLPAIADNNDGTPEPPATDAKQTPPILPVVETKKPSLARNVEAFLAKSRQKSDKVK